MEFGIHSESTSDARKRIEAAGEQFKQRQMDEQHRLKQERQSALDRARTLSRRLRIMDRFDHAYRLCKDLPPQITAREIISEVAYETGITVRAIVGDGRETPIVVARQKAMARIRDELGMSYPSIGKLFGGKDHTTVINAVRRHQARLRGEA